MAFTDAGYFEAACRNPMNALAQVSGNETHSHNANEENNAEHVIACTLLVSKHTTFMMQMTANTMPGHSVAVNRAFNSHAAPPKLL